MGLPGQSAVLHIKKALRHRFRCFLSGNNSQLSPQNIQFSRKSKQRRDLLIGGGFSKEHDAPLYLKVV